MENTKEPHLEYIINHGMPSFLNKAEISFHLNAVFNKYRDSFPGVPVHVDLVEKDAGQPVQQRMMGSIKNRKLRILISLNETPDQEVFRKLRFVMDKEQSNYKDNIDKINPLLRNRLKDIGIDLNSEKNTKANDLKGSLAQAGYKLDFDKRIGNLTDDDLYQLGTSIIVTGTGGVIFSDEKIVGEMAEKLEIS
ncbi:hypothetical protein QG516_25765 [Pedobacter gandavensis]|uniref:hypothetical protein n=1 Tax=Pedobacter gandavensis TaxID=2679963 RepID=UPI00247A87B5|nr:hypothetical protein [Pedobacter gandavensis]WGQ09924.1 hypothetical protein QG516_25765 [Pedobacter gandavensis]